MAIRQDIADKFNIIMLSKTFLNRESSHNLEIPGFHPIFRRDRGSFGGRVPCYVGSNYLPPVFEKRREVLFWGPSPYPPSPPSKPTFCLISRLLLKLAF